MERVAIRVCGARFKVSIARAEHIGEDAVYPRIGCNVIPHPLYVFSDLDDACVSPSVTVLLECVVYASWASNGKRAARTNISNQAPKVLDLTSVLLK